MFSGIDNIMWNIQSECVDGVNTQCWLKLLLYDELSLKGRIISLYNYMLLGPYHSYPR